MLKNSENQKLQSENKPGTYIQIIIISPPVWYYFQFYNSAYIFCTNIRLEKKQIKSFLDLLLDVLNENPDQMTIKDIREEVDTFLFEGHDTSSIAMTMTILLLGMHQDIQVRYVFFFHT